MFNNMETLHTNSNIKTFSLTSKYSCKTILSQPKYVHAIFLYRSIVLSIPLRFLFLTHARILLDNSTCVQNPFTNENNFSKSTIQDLFHTETLRLCTHVATCLCLNMPLHPTHAMAPI